MIETDKTVIALGYFDGVHTGHRAIFARAVNIANSRDAFAVALTFCFDGERLLAKGEGDLLTLDTRLRLIFECGVNRCCVDSFETIRSLTSREYFERYVFSKNPVAVVCGRDYACGSDRAGVKALSELCTANGVLLDVVEKLSAGGAEVSASRIKELLRQGEIQHANELLGYEYTVENTVVAGRRLGRTLGFPTINLSMEGLFVPRRGVYATQTEIRGLKYDSITNIGSRPTVHGDGRVFAETHILGFSDEVYGERAAVRLLRFIRDERRFENADELKKAVENDIKQVARRDK